jgi:hypothetical protein
MVTDKRATEENWEEDELLETQLNVVREDLVWSDL